MNPTEAAARFHADALRPLHQANRRRAHRYFAPAPDPDRDSYWEPVIARPDGTEPRTLGESDGAALLVLAGTLWLEQGEELLAQLLPELEELRRLVFEPSAEPQPASLPYSTYPLF